MYLANVIVAVIIVAIGAMFYPHWPVLLTVPFVVLLLATAEYARRKDRAREDRRSHSPYDHPRLKSGLRIEPRILKIYVGDVVRPTHPSDI